MPLLAPWTQDKAAFAAAIAAIPDGTTVYSNGLISRNPTGIDAMTPDGRWTWNLTTHDGTIAAPDRVEVWHSVAGAVPTKVAVLSASGTPLTLATRATNGESVRLGAAMLRTSDTGGFAYGAGVGAANNNNVIFGIYAGEKITTGDGNLIVGNRSSSRLTTGSFNVALASNMHTTTGTGNIAVSGVGNGAWLVSNGTTAHFTQPPGGKVELYVDGGTDVREDGVPISGYHTPAPGPHTYTGQNMSITMRSGGAINNSFLAGQYSYVSHDKGFAWHGYAAGANTAQFFDNNLPSGSARMFLGPDRLVTLTELKAVVASATDFNDFKTKIAALS
jgi:hypothetical protein